MKKIRNFVLAALAATSVATAAHSTYPNQFVNYPSPEIFFRAAVRAATPAPAAPPSRAVLASCAVLGILIVKASRE